MMVEESSAFTHQNDEPTMVCEKVDGGAEMTDEALEERVKMLELENTEMKRQRTEDAKANEKVACMFATQEQNWIAEKKSLQRQMQALFAQFRVIEAKKEDTISSLGKNLEEKEQQMRRKDEEIETMISNSKEWKERARRTEELVEELRLKLAKQTEEHSDELLKHEAALAELASKERELETEMVRNARQADTAKRELEEALKRKEEADGAVEKLSEDIAGLRRHGEQKDKILSAMLRKSKVDTAEKSMLVKEVKVLKARRKQAELEAERWRAASEPSRRRKGFQLPVHLVEAGTSHNRNGVHKRALRLEYLEEVESKKESELAVAREKEVVMGKDYGRFHGGEADELVMIDIRQLEDWIQSETEKHAAFIEQRHCADIEAFTEQMRVKDEKLEGVRWQLLSTELEQKHIHSRIRGLEASLSRVEDENANLESLLLEKDKDLQSIRDRFASHLLTCRKKWNHHWAGSEFLDPQTLWAEVQLSRIRNQNQPGTTTSVDLDDDEKNMKEQQAVLESSRSDEIAVAGDPGRIDHEPPTSEQKQHSTKWKMDINAMGVSYKIQRLKQQLLVVEKLMRRDSAPKAETSDEGKVDEKIRPRKGFHTLVSLLNKQAKRYQSLEDRANDLCNRMVGTFVIFRGTIKLLTTWGFYETCPTENLPDPTPPLVCSCFQRKETERGADGRSPEHIETLGRLLEETFKLQRYMVATGQKLMEIQSRMTCSFIDGEEKTGRAAGFNVGQFADMVRCLLREIQRGLEVRIARIIGDIEGTIARDGILLHMR